MSKYTILDWDATASGNTDLGASLNTSGTGLVSTADDSFREIMAQVSRYNKDLVGLGVTVGGNANAVTLAVNQPWTALADGQVVGWKHTGGPNTGAMTVTVTPSGGSAFATKDLVQNGGAAFVGGEILDNAYVIARYDATLDDYVQINGGGSAAAATTSAAGIVELATLAETLAGTDTSRVPTVNNLYFPTGHLYGLTLSNNATDATNDIDIAAGTARDGSDSYNMILASALTKRLDAAWAVGTGNGGLDTGSIANTTYHVWLIKRSDTGVVDALFSTSASSPTMPTNYDIKRRIGSIVRTGGAIKAFVQSGDNFSWVSPVEDVSAANPGTSAVTRTLTVPVGIVVQANIMAQLANITNANIFGLMSPLSVTDNAASSTNYNFGANGAVARYSSELLILTNTSGQVRSRISVSGASDTLSINTLGWVDSRGRVG